MTSSTAARNAITNLLSETTEAECNTLTATLDSFEADAGSNASVLAQIHALSAPPPPLPAPLAPVNFRAGETNGPVGTLRTYGGTDSPLAVELAWDQPADGAQFRLDYKGNTGNPAGPQEWTEHPTNQPGIDGERATLMIYQPPGSVLLLRLTAFLNAQDSAPVLLAYVVPALPE